MSVCSDRINRLAAHYNYTHYLEIGVFKGETFHNVNMQHRSAVDPNFLFNISDYESLPNTYFFTQKSDEFFSNMDKIHNEVYNQKIFYDIVYIDGLHVFKQALRDFTNSLMHTHEKTIWIFDDTIPCDPWSSLPNQKQCYKLRDLAGSKSRAWHGDVFKCVFTIHDFYPDISYATVYDHGNPQTVCWRTKYPAQRKRIFNNIDNIAFLSYFDMLENCYVLNLIKDDELESHIGECFESPSKDSVMYLPLIIKNILKDKENSAHASPPNHTQNSFFRLKNVWHSIRNLFLQKKKELS